MKTIEQITDELVDDYADSCFSDYMFLRSVVRAYIEEFDEDQRREMHRSAFATEDGDDEYSDINEIGLRAAEAIKDSETRDQSEE